MAQIERLIAELTQEAGTTRRLLERVPEEKLTWRPHPKSMTLGRLAMHVALIPKAIAGLLSELDREIPNVAIPEPSTRIEIVAALDTSLAAAIDKLWEWGERGLDETWRLRSNGKTLIERPRGAAVRTIMLNHWYHHRGQLTVYLRLLDVALPSIYGPTADESPF